MAVSTKQIKTRIRSVGNTRKITKAMEMVAAAKMRRAVSAVVDARFYARAAQRMLTSLLPYVDQSHHSLLMTPEKTGKHLSVVISSNRGLCGGFNAQIVRQALESAKDSSQHDFIVLGKVGGETLARSNQKIVAMFNKSDAGIHITDVLSIAKMILTEYQRGTYDQVSVVYTDYASAFKQHPRTTVVLPFQVAPDPELGAVNRAMPAIDTKSREYVFEPGAGEVLDQLLPHMVESQLYQALLESNASEHSARMVAMSNASRAAADMIDELTLLFNQARQASITQEIAEITGGKAALEQ